MSLQFIRPFLGLLIFVLTLAVGTSQAATVLITGSNRGIWTCTAKVESYLLT